MAGLPRALVREGFTVNIIVPADKEEYFKNIFSDANIHIIGVREKINKRDIFFRKLCLLLTPTRATRIKRRAEAGGFSLYFFWFLEIFVYLFRLLPGIRTFVRFFDYQFIRSFEIKELFDKHPCQVVCSTDIQNEIDVKILHEARRRKIKTLGCVRSWDNLSSKGIPRALPLCFAVPSHIVEKELRTMGAVSTIPIHVIGVPHHDSYWHYVPQKKDDFVNKWELDPRKPIILFAPIGNRYIKNNTLDQKVLEALSSMDVNILVRLPPTDTVTISNFTSQKGIVKFHETGIRPWKGAHVSGVSKANEISNEDENNLKEELSHSDVLVTGQSTLVIDAAIFNLPSVIINFDSEPRPYRDSVRRYYDYDYYAPILKTGGITLADSLNDVLIAVHAYVQSRTLHASGRVSIAEQQSPYGGNALRRLVTTVIDLASS